MKNRLRGECRIRVCGVFPESVLNGCAMQSVEIWNMTNEDEYTLTFSVYEKDLAAARQIADKCMCQSELLTSRGGSQRRSFIKAHIWFFLSLSLVLILLGVSTLFIWDIDVYGCESLSKGEILRALSECGVECGSYWPHISSDLVRSEMLCRLPELAWMTVNISGSRAIVLTVERQEKPEIYIESRGADIIASNTGIVSEISVLNGKALVQKGESVVKGEILISGYVESLSHSPKTVRAQGDIEAYTWYEQSAVFPSDVSGKLRSDRSRRRIVLNFGRHRINLYAFGRKYVDECDKIVDNYIIGLDGIFALPVSITVESFIPYKKTSPCPADTDAMAERLRCRLDETIDGDILACTFSCAEKDGLSVLTMRASCKENIALLKEFVMADYAP